MSTIKYGGLTRTQWRSYIAAGEKFHGEKISQGQAIMHLMQELDDMEEAFDNVVQELMHATEL